MSPKLKALLQEAAQRLENIAAAIKAELTAPEPVDNSDPKAKRRARNQRYYIKRKVAKQLMKQPDGLSASEKAKRLRQARNHRYYLKRKAKCSSGNNTPFGSSTPPQTPSSNGSGSHLCAPIVTVETVLQTQEPIMVRSAGKRLTKSSAPMCNNIYNNNLSPLEPELNLGLESNTKDSPNGSDRSLKPEREGVRSKKSDDWRDDRRREVWRIGLQLLQSVGLPENKARIMIGKWIKGLSVDSLLTILQKAHQQGVLDPIPYVEKAVRNVRQRYASAEAETADCFYSNTKNWREIERRETMYIP